MNNQSSFAKRLKRQVIGRRRNYFVSTSPGLESLCLNELSALSGSITNIKVVSGGVEFEGRLADCYAANLYLRFANRVLMRAEAFSATNFRQLEKKLAAVPWELFFGPEAAPVVQVAAHKSRLYHTAAVREKIIESIERRFSGLNTKEDKKQLYEKQLIFVRFQDDHCTISIDSSGENLYKRGYKMHAHEAPLRETIAAAVLKLAGYSGQKPLIDPLCGSGSFSMEAAMMTKNIPPGYFRKFSFVDWPSFSAKKWSYMKHEAEKQIRDIRRPFIMASDQDADACLMFKENLKKFSLSDAINVACRDFFSFSPSDLYEKEWPGKKGLVVINPPYGLRLKNKEESQKILAEIFKKLKNDYKGWRIAVIVSNRKFLKNMWLDLKKRPLFHGGLRLMLVVGRIPK